MQLLAVAVNAASGLHARPAANLVQTAMGFKSEIYIVKDGRKANAKSMISLLALGVRCGDRVTIHADGVDETEAIAAIRQLAQSNFDGAVKGGVQEVKILLCCSAGMSTSLLVEKMKKAAQDRQLQVDIEAIPVADFESRVDEATVVLLGPQVRYKLAEFKRVADARGKPIDVIDMVAYGMVNGTKVLEQALAVIRSSIPKGGSDA